MHPAIRKSCCYQQRTSVLFSSLRFSFLVYLNNNWGSSNGHDLIDDDGYYYYHNHHYYYIFRLLLLGWPCLSGAFGPGDSRWCLQPDPFGDHLPCRAHPGCPAGSVPVTGFLSRLFTGASRPPQNGRLTYLAWWNRTPQFAVLYYLLSQEFSLVVTPWLTPQQWPGHCDI